MGMMERHRWLWGASLLLGACPSSDDSTDTTSSALSSTTGSPTDTAGSTTDTASAATSAATTSTNPTSDTTATATDGADTSGHGLNFDLGSLPDSPEIDMGCRKVDFLFAIDNSGSMTAQQIQLLNSFDGFITAIQASLEDSVDSYHVGVVTSDNYSGNAPGCNTLGDLVSQTAGSNSSNTDCTPFAQGDRFATELDDLMVKFPCIAQVGTTGSGTEQPVTATIAALDPAKAVPGGCNENFLRDDAILVVVVLTDDPPASTLDDANPATDTSGWYDAVVAAKNGDPEAMVVLGFVPWMNVGCVPLTIESPNLIGFVESFGDQGVLASICEPDYGPIFAEAVSTIVTTCENFDPPA